MSAFGTIRPGDKITFGRIAIPSILQETGVAVQVNETHVSVRTEHGFVWVPRHRISRVVHPSRPVAPEPARARFDSR